jgi:hypothetical protein
LVKSQVLAATTSARYYNGFYLKVIQSKNPNCSWSGYPPADNCLFLREAVQAVYNIGKIPAVFSTFNIWKQIFGTTCDTFATSTGAYLWYAKYESNGKVNATKTTNDYVPFGGWVVSGNRVWVKQIGGTVNIPSCGSSVFDIVWTPNATFS